MNQEVVSDDLGCRWLMSSEKRTHFHPLPYGCGFYNKQTSQTHVRNAVSYKQEQARRKTTAARIKRKAGLNFEKLNAKLSTVYGKNGLSINNTALD